MIKSKLYNLIILIFLSSCLQEISPCEIIDIKVDDIASKKTLERKFIANDECFVLSVISKLNDTSLSDCDFAEIERKLADMVLLGGCGIDCHDEGWPLVSEDKKIKIRRRIVYLYESYAQSSLFMKRKAWHTCGYGIDMMKYCREPLFSKSEKEIGQEVMRDLNKIYKLCKNSD